MSQQITKYIKEYTVKSYEADCHGFLRILTLMNILQDIACENADLLGLGFAQCHAHNLIWVGSNYLIKIKRLPRIDEHFVIETWPAEAKLWGAIRNFNIKDTNGEVIACASSQWVLVDYERRRPVALSKYFPDYKCLDERVMEDDFHKLPEVENPDLIKEFAVRFDDIDVNNHVNNAVYPVWASESLDSKYRISHLPTEIELNFKKEALFGEKVKVETKQNESESIHVIRDEKSGDELAKCLIKWREITSERLA